MAEMSELEPRISRLEQARIDLEEAMVVMALKRRLPSD
jgi:hypothetical protein